MQVRHKRLDDIYGVRHPQIADESSPMNGP